MWGVKVVSLDSGKTLFETNAQKLFSPASNSKLYTVALGLDRLGPDYQIKTSVLIAEQPSKGGKLKGDLVLVGRGDPTINARVHGKDLFAALKPFVAIVTNAGITHITGDLIGDETFFKGAPYGSGWAWDDMENDYGAEISALTFNDNTLQLVVKPGSRVGEACHLRLVPSAPFMVLSNLTKTASPGARAHISFFRPIDSNIVYVNGTLASGGTNHLEDVPVHSPAEMFLYYFKQALAKDGVTVDGKLRVVSSFPVTAKALDRAGWIEVGTVPSLPMKDVAREIMKPSQNLYTDLLLAHVGEKARTQETPADTTSEDLGIRELNKFLTQIGVQKGDVHFEEGSGLSRNNLTTPNATIKLLEHMHKHAAGGAYRDAMPIAGVDGTLRNRMKGTAAAGNMHAKTGTLRWANSLSGYITTVARENLAFSIMLNRYSSPDARASGRSEIDGIGIMLAGLQEKSAQ